MKNKIIQKSIVVVALLFAGACTKDFESANINPNAPENVPATSLLLSGIATGIFGVVTERYGLPPIQSYQNTIGDCGHWVQYFSGIQYPDLDRYIVDPTGFSLVWGTYYNALEDLQEIIDNPANGDNMVAAAMVMRVFLYSQMVDLLGDIPYSQALHVQAYVQPVYDTQESIYKDLTAQLKLAAATFDPAKDKLGAGDILYGDDVRQWEKFANSLRARLLNHYKHLDPQANLELVQLLSNPSDFPVFETSADNAQLIPTHVFPYRNTMFSFTVNGTLTNNDGVSASLVNMLKSLNDPRLPVYAQPNNMGEYVGKPSGAPPAATLSDYSNIGKVFRDDPYFPATAMTFPELLFIKAEVLHNKQAYLNGIAAAMDAYGLTPDADYLTAAAAAFDANEQEAIINQKWLALYGRNSIEAFTEFRRTGFPATIQEAQNVAADIQGRGVPHRLSYPNSEESTNGTNLQAARARQNIEGGVRAIYGDKMWWAK
jgi:hypothetical protein